MYTHIHTHMQSNKVCSFWPGGEKKSSLLFHMAPKPLRAGLVAMGVVGLMQALHAPAGPCRSSQLVSKGPGKGAGRQPGKPGQCSISARAETRVMVVILSCKLERMPRPLQKCPRRRQGPQASQAGRGVSVVCGLAAGGGRAATGFPLAPAAAAGFLREGEGLGRAARWLRTLGAR